MKTSIILKEERSDIISQLENIKDVATTEERDLTSEENEQVDGLLQEVDNLDVQIERAEKMETIKRNAAVVSGVTAKKNDKEYRNWSLFKAINEIRKGGLTGLEAEMHQEAERENRGNLEGIGMPTFMTEKRTTITQGTSAIAPTMTSAFQEGLIEGALWNKVGLTNLGNMAANTIVPVTKTSAAIWDTETGNGDDIGDNFEKVTLSPNRINGYADISNVILAQNGQAAESAVMRDMARQVSKAIDTNMWSTSNQGSGPGSIPATTDVLTFTEAAYGTGSVASDMLEAIQTIANDHGLDGNLGFVNSFHGYSAIKSEAMVGSVSPLYADDKLAGYPGYFSGAATGTAGVSFDGMFGDFSKIVLCSFGPTNILVDPYTRATNNEVRLVLNQHYDWKLTDGKAFVKYTTLLA
jgi:HK97 family phage major capsid protein